MFKKWKESARTKVENIYRTIRKWIFYTKMAFLILFIIAAVLLLSWALTKVNSVRPNNTQEVPTSAQPSTPPSKKTSSQQQPKEQKKPSLESGVPQEPTQRNKPTKKNEGPTEPNTSKSRQAPLQKQEESREAPASPDSTAETNELPSPSQPEAESTERGGVRQFTLTAYPEKVQIDEQLAIDGWTYNGTVPGPVIRVKEGEQVRITLRNQIPGIGTSIHWHGIPKRNSMDGVPYVTQPPVNFGEQFVYEFTAKPAGTYIYHAHGGTLQVNKGLVGPFIIESVEPTAYPKADTEWIVGLDEMEISGEGDPPPATDGNRMDQSMMQKMMPNALLGTLDVYNVFTVNWKRDPKHVFEAKANEWVRLRLLNYGFQTHRIKVEGMKMYVTHMGGSPLPAAQPVDYAVISPFERVSVYLIGTKPGEYNMFDIDPGHSEFGMRAKVSLSPSGTLDDNKRPESLQLADPPDNAPRYQGITAGIPGPDTTEYDHVYNMDLGMTMGPGGMAWGINGVIWSSLENYKKVEPYKVRLGETIKINLFNRSPESHPMHLHGHHFRVVAINGQSIAEPWLSKDVINVKPMQRISIAFEADNPGDWLFHCHQDHHADDGLITYFSYVESRTSE
ncbi:multicopper oxidase domain-containing protein [Halobacillus naozhouensis]